MPDTKLNDEPDTYPDSFIDWITSLDTKEIIRSMWLRMSLDERNEFVEQDVDDRDHPNTYPYKKCCNCEDRKSCGMYFGDDWYCDECYPEDEEEDEEASQTSQ